MMKCIVQHRYVELFSTCHNHSVLAAWNPPCWKARISVEDSVKLVGTVSDEEIASGLWSLKAFKALGPDGLHPGFFQRFSLLVGASVKDEVKQIFATSKMPEYLNQTLITLVPKCNNPESFNNYRPISLCNTVYKLVPKILVARIRSLLADLVSPF
uniref:Reverse transcriptase n=1 Tax=Quercus lobata TaxID=97700 RepID=A0A7N2MI38_QUELO